MNFEWDPEKARSNYRKHRVDFETAMQIFDDPDALVEEDKTSTIELRFSIIGRSKLGLLYAIYTERREDVTRIISARRAEKHEQRKYLRSISEAAGRL